jgi:hypothetical protein
MSDEILRDSFYTELENEERLKSESFLTEDEVVDLEDDKPLSCTTVGDEEVVKTIKHVNFGFIKSCPSSSDASKFQQLTVIATMSHHHHDKFVKSLKDRAERKEQEKERSMRFNSLMKKECFGQCVNTVCKNDADRQLCRLLNRCC